MKLDPVMVALALFFGGCWITVVAGVFWLNGLSPILYGIPMFLGSSIVFYMIFTEGNRR